MGFLGVLPISGVSKERVTLWSGCIGLTALAGFSGQRPEWDGATPSPSGEPTTTKAERVVIVGYNRKPLFFSASRVTGFRSPPSWRVFATVAYWGCTDQYKVKFID